MERWLRLGVLAAGIALVTGLAYGKTQPPAGVIAVSAGDAVVLADPQGGWTTSVPAGEVGWLFPAPAGVLFAPDLVHGRTTVIDLATRSASDHFDGVTMPHFGDQPDRYLVVAGDILVVSYPERALMKRIRAGITSPWQVLPVSASVLLVLERDPRGEDAPRLVAVDMISERVIYRRALPRGVVRVAVSPALGVLAVADTDTAAIRLLDPATIALVESLPVDGSPRDVAFLADGRTLVAACAGASGGGVVSRWSLKRGKHGLKIKGERSTALDGVPLRVAVSPYGTPQVAVGLEDARVAVLDVKEGRRQAVIDLPAAPRDVVWCDPAAPGPTLPKWSDEEEPTLEIGPG